MVQALAAETGQRYRGVLYGGFIATRQRVKLIEYNCRFGDPEAMNVLPLLEGDFVALARSVAVGELDPASARFAPKATVCKYVVPTAYPEPSPAGDTIDVPPSLQRDRGNARWYWAASRQEGEQVVLTGSRAGAVLGIGDTLDEAEQVAEQAVREVAGDVRHRVDIGTARLVSSRVSHMRELRGVRV